MLERERGGAEKTKKWERFGVRVEIPAIAVAVVGGNGDVGG